MDRTCKWICAALAVGLWANAAVVLIKPSMVAAQNKGDITESLESIESSLSSIESTLSTIRGKVSDIDDGSCSNKRICR